MVSIRYSVPICMKFESHIVCKEIYRCEYFYWFIVKINKYIQIFIKGIASFTLSTVKSNFYSISLCVFSVPFPWTIICAGLNSFLPLSTWHHPISFSESVKCQSYQKLKWAAQFVCLRFRLVVSSLHLFVPLYPDNVFRILYRIRGFLVFMVHPRRDYSLPSGQTVGGLARVLSIFKCKEMSTVHGASARSVCSSVSMCRVSL